LTYFQFERFPESIEQYQQLVRRAMHGQASRRFLSYWKDGDLDRDRIAEAQRKISS
jgi:hypothetical protein